MNNIWFSWSQVFNDSLLQLWFGFVQFTPKLIVAIVFFIIGWMLGSVISKAFVQVFAALKIDKLFASIGTDNLLRKAGMNLNTGYFVGQVAKWFVVIVFLLPSLNLVGLDYIASFLKDDVLGFLPRVVIAAFILIIATMVSEATSKLVIASTKAMSLHSANLLGAIAKYAVWVFALIIAFGQLGIAETYMNTLFAGIIGMLALGGALAFGLGGKEAAARFLAKLSEEASHR
jgi:hypothetical protein